VKKKAGEFHAFLFFCSQILLPYEPKARKYFLVQDSLICHLERSVVESKDLIRFLDPPAGGLGMTRLKKFEKVYVSYINLNNLINN
jgi:hypothetical protein